MEKKGSEPPVITEKNKRRAPGEINLSSLASRRLLRTWQVAARFAFAVLACVTPLASQVREIRGQVVDANTGQPLEKVLIRNYRGEGRTETDALGRFRIEVSPEAELLFSSVGYRPYRLPLSAEENQEFEIRLVPDTLRTSQKLDVYAGPFALEPAAAGNALSLAGTELRNLSSVLAEDPLRAVQALPGVNANDDFQSQLSLRGAGFQRIGVYVDGLLLHSPYHTAQGDPSNPSLTVLSSDLMESVVLFPSAPPPQLSDRTAAAVDLRLRDGDRKKVSARGAVSASNASVSLEGPLGRQERASWLLSARKSYLQYLIRSTTDEPGLVFGFGDVQARLSYDWTPRHTGRLTIIHGRSGLDRRGAENRVGLNGLFDTDYDFTVAQASSRWFPLSGLSLQNSFAWMRESHLNRNRNYDPLSGGQYGEWVYNGDHFWQWKEQSTLFFGATLRRLRDYGFLDRHNASPPFVVHLDQWRGVGFRSGAHLFQQVTLWSGKLQLRAGGRYDHHDSNRIHSWSPMSSVSLTLSNRTALSLNWGINVQYPELSQSYSRFGRRTLLPERSNAVNFALEHRFEERTRVRFELYQRLDRDLIWRPDFEARIRNGRIYLGNLFAPYANVVRGYARGAQLFVQRRTSNGLAGWVSYAWGTSLYRDGFSGVSFRSDFDQRHTINVFGSYRLRPTINVSSRWFYGSGFPARGYLRGGSLSQVFLASSRNELRMPAYHRLDVRANKTFVKNGWHVTLFAEILNLYRRRNLRFDELLGVQPQTGLARLAVDPMLPFLPSAGLAVEF
ncbi:MAG: TonB-dependent receptor [Bryobacteraceae bacterium]|nr:TonB-dependent receptor [Bryobacteraceae bacterium]MDW8377558.1 carboxypeptidase-like regulatory domain-containing protein [Bryobacterales bacterium]